MYHTLNGAICSVTENRGTICREILEALPRWFGIPESIDEYVASAEDTDMLGYVDDGVIGGFVMLRNTSEFATDVYLMAIRPELHRRSIGRSLIAAAEVWARDRGRRYLTVKTVGPSRPDASYERTRAFYAAVGFMPLEEFIGLWDGNPCLLLIKQIDPFLRVARPSNNLALLVPFYRDALGLDIIGSFEGHAGFDGIMFGKSGSPYHFEFTHEASGGPVAAPHAEDLIVFYISDRAEWKATVDRLRARGFAAVPSHNPYWDRGGITFADPDSRYIVIYNATWP